MRLERVVANKRLVVYCKEIQRDQAQSLLEALSGIHTQGLSLEDGTHIQFGWSLLALRAHGNELVVWEPDYLGDPFADHLQQADVTLQVVSEQAAVLNTIGIGGEAASYNTKVVVAKGCLREKALYLERRAPVDKQDSGWFVGRVNQEKELAEEDCETHYIFELLRHRPALMKVLALPVGYLVIFDGDGIRALFNERGEDVVSQVS